MRMEVIEKKRLSRGGLSHRRRVAAALAQRVSVRGRCCSPGLCQRLVSSWRGVAAAAVSAHWDSAAGGLVALVPTMLRRQEDSEGWGRLWSLHTLLPGALTAHPSHSRRTGVPTALLGTTSQRHRKFWVGRRHF